MSFWKKIFGSKESAKANIAGKKATEPPAASNPQPQSTQTLPPTQKRDGRGTVGFFLFEYGVMRMSYGEQAFDAIYESVSSSHGKCIFHDGDDLRQLVPQLLNQADRKELACPETTITKPGVYLVGLWTDDIASFKRVHSHLVEKGLAGYLGHLTLPLRLTPVEFGQQMIDWRLPASISLVDGKVVKGTSKYGIGINKNDHSLLDVAKRGQLENVKGLIGNGADVHEENADKRGGQFITHNEDSITALMGASEKGDFKMVQALLADGADVNAKNKDGETALMYASGEGHLEVVQLLLANGADVNAKTYPYNGPHIMPRGTGWTALMMGSGQFKVVQLLLANGADVNAKNSRGETALFMASVGGRLEVVQLLLANKADVNAKRDGCETALMMASMIGHKDVRELLIRAGAK